MNEKNSQLVENLQLSEVKDIYMSRCIQLARIGGGYVAPNPMVGAVIVYNDEIIGEGYHHRYGEAHAEPNAINAVQNKELLKYSTLYVNLEPCSFYGKTPPCANLIVKHGIPKVVIGTLDPHPKVSGKGVEILRNAGIEVVVGVMEVECRELNKRFFTFQNQKRPYVLLKWAQTQDGFIDKIRTDASESPLIISNNVTKLLTHKMRSENQSILVSTNTVLLDNPSLTVRNWTGKNPIRLAVDRTGKIPDNYHLFDGITQTIIFTKLEKRPKNQLEYIVINFDEKCIQSILEEVYKKNIHSILVEGGSKLLGSFIESGLWDEANVEVSPQTIGEGVLAPLLPFLSVKRTTIDGHEWLFYKNIRKAKFS